MYTLKAVHGIGIGSKCKRNTVKERHMYTLGSRAGFTGKMRFELSREARLCNVGSMSGREKHNLR